VSKNDILQNFGTYTRNGNLFVCLEKGVTIKKQKGPKGEENKSAQPRGRIEGELPLGLVKSTRAKNIVFASGFLKLNADRLLPVLTAMFKESEDVVPVSHAGKNGIPPSVGGDSSNTTVGIIKNLSIASTPKMPHDHGSKDVASSVISAAGGGVDTIGVV